MAMMTYSIDGSFHSLRGWLLVPRLRGTLPNNILVVYKQISRRRSY